MSKKLTSRSIIFAARDNDLEKVEYYITQAKQQGKLQYINKFIGEESPILHALGHGNYNMTKLLVSNGALNKDFISKYTDDSLFLLYTRASYSTDCAKLIFKDCNLSKLPEYTRKSIVINVIKNADQEILDLLLNQHKNMFSFTEDSAKEILDFEKQLSDNSDLVASTASSLSSVVESFNLEDRKKHEVNDMLNSYKGLTAANKIYNL